MVPGNLKWDGIDIWPVLTRQDEPLPTRTLYSAAPGFRARMVRHGDWKLVRTESSGKRSATEELFNLATDPAESQNLAQQHPDILAEMQQRLTEISARDRDAEVTRER